MDGRCCVPRSPGSTSPAEPSRALGLGWQASAALGYTGLVLTLGGICPSHHIPSQTLTYSSGVRTGCRDAREDKPEVPESEHCLHSWTDHRYLRETQACAAVRPLACSCPALVFWDAEWRVSALALRQRSLLKLRLGLRLDRGRCGNQPPSGLPSLPPLASGIALITASALPCFLP